MIERYCATCNSTGEVDCLCGGDLCCCLEGPTLPCPDCDGGALLWDDGYDDYMPDLLDEPESQAAGGREP